MKIGLTYDLKKDYLDMGFDEQVCAEFDSPYTIESIENTLQDLGYETERIGNLYSLVQYLASGKKSDLIFNIAEGLNHRSRESQIPSLLEGYDIPFVFSDSTTLAITLDKYLTKQVLKESKVKTTTSSILENEEDIKKFKGKKFPYFIKPVYGGTGMGISNKSIVNNKEELEKEALALIDNFSQGVLVEPFLSGREFTVGILGTKDKAKAVGTLEIVVDKKSDDGVYSYLTKQNYKDCTYYKLPEQEICDKCEKLALSAWKALGCRDGGRIDLKSDEDGNIYILELNPLAGLHPIDSDLPILCKYKNLSYKELINTIIDSAKERIKK